MDEKLARIVGKLVREIDCSYKCKGTKIQELADQIKITNTIQGPVASGVKAPKIKVAVQVNMEMEVDEAEYDANPPDYFYRHVEERMRQGNFHVTTTKIPIDDGID